MGISLALFSAVFISLRDVVSKKLSIRVDNLTSTFASFLFALPFYLFVLMLLYLLGYEDFSFTKSFLYWIGIRATLDTFAEYSKMVALANAEISVVSSIFTLYPILLIILSPIITGDPLTWPILIGVLFSVFGSLLILYKPSKEHNNIKGLVAAGITCCFLSLNACVDRMAVQEASATLSGFTMTLISCVLIAPLILRHKTRVQSLVVNIRPFLTRGLFECLYMICKLGALVFMQAPQLATFKNVGLLFAVFSGRALFKETGFLRKSLGAILSIAGMVIALDL